MHVDEDTAAWLDGLTSDGAARDAAQTRLHELLRRVARHELSRRDPGWLRGPERDDVAHQAADDAMVAILGKLADFRGESRFTTWAYRFVVLEVSHKLGRHYWRHHEVRVEGMEDWDRFFGEVGLDPSYDVAGKELAAALRRAIDALTQRQRELFVAIVIEGVPLDAMVERLGSNRNAIYKVIFDARRKIRAALVADGYLEGGDHQC